MKLWCSQSSQKNSSGALHVAHSAEQKRGPPAPAPLGVCLLGQALLALVDVEHGGAKGGAGRDALRQVAGAGGGLRDLLRDDAALQLGLGGVRGHQRHREGQLRRAVVVVCDRAACVVVVCTTDQTDEALAADQSPVCPDAPVPGCVDTLKNMLLGLRRDIISPFACIWIAPSFQPEHRQRDHF